jgi:dTDP-4-amino-4,6-dideoxygalactose transaminase
MRAQFLPFHIPDISEDDVQAVVETLRSGWLTTGRIEAVSKIAHRNHR